ncbi:MAG: DinB family protein [Vicinamibacteria bacterium]|jgi:uncharacterized damage-inducible protein DinB|nr:DinB family protein [Vicinamibacteria bacterium]
MTISETLLPEFDQEMATTRKYLERVPEAHAEWRPHPKSMVLGRLAGHLAEIPTWASATLRATELDMTPKDGAPVERLVSAKPAELLKVFDLNVKQARQAIADAADADYSVPWSLKGGGQTYFTLPRAVVLRSFVFSHLIHHRAQLGVYLRMHDVPVPATYGPSADEQGM